MTKRQLDLLRADGPVRQRQGPAWVGAALAGLYLIVLINIDFVVPARDSLIDYYGVAALIAAATLDWRLTGATAVVALGAAAVTAQVHDHHLASSTVALKLGSTAAYAVVAMIVAAIRERREGRLEEMTEVAEVAEHAIVRSAPISLPDLEVALVYRSASNLASVGGDLYEAVPTAYGSRLIIGDAKGKGLPAVQLAAVVLGAFRHAALSEPDLGQLVIDLDRTVAAFGTEEDFVTALIIEVDEIDIRLVCCGHPWPLIGPPGYVRPIPVEPSLPLGLGGTREVQVRGFPTRQIFVAYTDGLVEARDQVGDMLSIDSVSSAIDTWEPDEAIRIMEKAFIDHVAGTVQDDVTILAMKRIPG